MTDALHLFVIEDEEDDLLLIQKSLERAGHRVTTCRTADDAQIVLAHNPFDLIIVDNFLRGSPISGLDLIKKLSEAGITVPVIMLTGKGNQELVAEVLHAGAIDYIVKDNRLQYLLELPKRVGESVKRHKLERNNDLLKKALESARDGIMITDLHGKIEFVNQALISMTGYSREELIGQNPRLLSSHLHPPQVYAKMWKTILSRHSWQGELTNSRKDGTLFQASITISPIEDMHHQLTHFVGIERDVTEHKQVERQLLQAQKMQSMGTLAGGVAHEFNNLLAGINGYASLGLRETTLSVNVREFLQQVVTLSERAAQLTRQLLTFGRKPALSRCRILMPELLKSTAELVRHTLHQEVVLKIDASPEIDLLVEADSNQMQQALVNLSLNARDGIRERVAQDLHQADELPPKAGDPTAPPGRKPIRRRIVPLPQLAGLTGIDIVFRARHQVVLVNTPGFPQNIPPGDYVVVEVEDQGLGMTTDILNQALDPFFTTKDVGQGTGLGLPMVFGIIQGHQGYLSIESQYRVGTRILLYLPRLIESQGSDSAPELMLDPELLEPEIISSKTILVIDDEAAVRDVVRRFLEIAGHQCLSAATCQEAVERVSKQEVELVILDLMMPREDASTVFRCVRQCRPQVPILLCTGLPEAQPAPELCKEPNVGFIRKPFRMNELWYAVRKLLIQMEGFA